MKKSAVRILAGIFFLCGVVTAQAVDQVIIPQGGERWSIGSTVQVEWLLADAETVDLKLVADDDTEYVIVEAIDNTGHFQWVLSEDVTTGNSQVLQVVSSEDDAVSVESTAINIQEQAEAETFQGNRQEYDEDLSDRARVYQPGEGEVIRVGDQGFILVGWDDVDNWLLDEVKIELREHGGTVLDEDTQTITASYDWQLDDSQCEDTACYFRINSTQHSDRVVTSGYFTVAGDDVETTAAEAVDCGNDAEVEDKVFELGGELIVNWTDEAETLGQDLRIELYKGGRYYRLISERELASAGNALSWTIPHTVVEGVDYTVRVSSRTDGTVFGFSDAFQIDSPREEDDLVTMEVSTPDTETEWEEMDGTTVTIEWQDNENNEDLLFIGRPDDVKLVLYKSERRFKTIFSASLTNSEVLSYVNQPETHDWDLLNTIPSGDDYSLRVLSADGGAGDETDYADSSPFAILTEGLSISDVTAVDESDGDATFTVRLSPAPENEEQVTVEYTSSDGNAVEGSDYTAVTGTLTFDAGVTTQTFTVSVVDDSTAENDETVILVLSDPDPADTPIADRTGRLTISDDDEGTGTECPLAVATICPEDTEDCPQDENEADDAIVLIDEDTTDDSSTSSSSAATSSTSSSATTSSTSSSATTSTTSSSTSTSTSTDGSTDSTSTASSDTSLSGSGSSDTDTGKDGDEDDDKDTVSATSAIVKSNCLVYVIFSDGTVKGRFCE